MIYLMIIMIALYLFTIIKSLIRLLRVTKYLQYTKKYIQLKPKHTKIKVIIPVYKEVPLIRETIIYFKKFSKICDVFFVTTSKEKGNETYNEIKKYIDKFHYKNIFLYNSPNEKGTMATQLNYAVEKLNDDDIVAIYNIDSRPQYETFTYVLNNIKSREIYQQVSCFDDNLKFILRSAQNWQNRWSIVYEMGKYLKKSGGMNFVYTIGHGLFAIKSDLKELGYWSDRNINEDNELGYRIVCNDFQIKPIPYFEKASFARSLKIYIKQQSVWINGPLYAFSYYNQQKKAGKKASLKYAFLNFKAALSWLLFPTISYLLIIVGFIYNWIFGIVFLLMMCFYITMINYLAKYILIKNKIVSTKNNINLLADILFFPIHSIGPIITICKILFRKNTIDKKYKTEK